MRVREKFFACLDKTTPKGNKQTATKVKKWANCTNYSFTSSADKLQNEESKEIDYCASSFSCSYSTCYLVTTTGKLFTANFKDEYEQFTPVSNIPAKLHITCVAAIDDNNAILLGKLDDSHITLAFKLNIGSSCNTVSEIKLPGEDCITVSASPTRVAFLVSCSTTTDEYNTQSQQLVYCDASSDCTNFTTVALPPAKIVSISVSDTLIAFITDFEVFVIGDLGKDTYNTVTCLKFKHAITQSTERLVSVKAANRYLLLQNQNKHVLAVGDNSKNQLGVQQKGLGKLFNAKTNEFVSVVRISADFFDKDAVMGIDCHDNTSIAWTKNKVFVWGEGIKTKQCFVSCDNTRVINAREDAFSSIANVVIAGDKLAIIANSKVSCLCSPIEEVAVLHKSNHEFIPKFIADSTEEIFDNTQSKHLFRLSSNADVVEQLMKDIDIGTPLEEQSSLEVHDYVNVIKTFIRKRADNGYYILPAGVFNKAPNTENEILLVSHLYFTILEWKQSTSVTNSILYNIAKQLFNCLNVVGNHCFDNDMTHKALATSLGPSLYNANTTVEIKRNNDISALLIRCSFLFDKLDTVRPSIRYSYVNFLDDYCSMLVNEVLQVHAPRDNLPGFHIEVMEKFIKACNTIVYLASNSTDACPDADLLAQLNRKLFEDGATFADCFCASSASMQFVKLFAAHYLPILPDGTILQEKSLHQAVENVLQVHQFFNSAILGKIKESFKQVYDEAMFDTLIHLFNKYTSKTLENTPLHGTQTQKLINSGFDDISKNYTEFAKKAEITKTAGVIGQLIKQRAFDEQTLNILAATIEMPSTTKPCYRLFASFYNFIFCACTTIKQLNDRAQLYTQVPECCADLVDTQAAPFEAQVEAVLTFKKDHFSRAQLFFFFNAFAKFAVIWSTLIKQRITNCNQALQLLGTDNSKAAVIKAKSDWTVINCQLHSYCTNLLNIYKNIQHNSTVKTYFGRLSAIDNIAKAIAML